MTATCRICGEPIRLVKGLWVDGTFDEPGINVSAGFAALCETGGAHDPDEATP